MIVCDKGHPISFRTLGSGVKINRFPNTAAICRKDRLCTNFHAMQKKFGKKIFNFIPKVDTKRTSLPKICLSISDFPRHTTFLRRRGY